MHLVVVVVVGGGWRMKNTLEPCWVLFTFCDINNNAPIYPQMTDNKMHYFGVQAGMLLQRRLRHKVALENEIWNLAFLNLLHSNTVSNNFEDLILS